MWVGLGFMFFLVPIQGVVFGVIFGSQKAFVKQTDKRVNIMNGENWVAMRSDRVARGSEG